MLLWVYMNITYIHHIFLSNIFYISHKLTKFRYNISFNTFIWFFHFYYSKLSIFIIVDDLNVAIGSYLESTNRPNYATAKTPNIDRLAKQGVRFEHAYVQSPLCNPSRASVAPDIMSVKIRSSLTPADFSSEICIVSF